MMIYLTALATGAMFGAGLVVSGMTDPANIHGFLDVTGAWRPHLALVMMAAIAVALPFFQWVLPRLRKPVYGTAFLAPLSTVIDKRLLLGAAVFGVGWGVSGLCPGPAIVGIAFLEPKLFGFLAAMLIGMTLADRLPSPSAKA
ncbi:MAG: YeeE/YedE family protein [Gammaproteobacteria bacterium]|nr:YeeE/YedE family protein [Gammaproteobacteria bacterium]